MPVGRIPELGLSQLQMRFHLSDRQYTVYRRLTAETIEYVTAENIIYNCEFVIPMKFSF